MKKVIYSFLLLLVFFSILIFNSGCATHLMYTVSSRSDPNYYIDKNQNIKYAFLPQEKENDSIIEANIFKLIEDNLDEKWIKTSIEEADYIFTVKFSMDKTEKIRPSTPPVNIKQSDGSVRTFQSPSGGSYTFYERKINITISSIDSDDNILAIWSADCISGGGTPDILLPAKYMIPYAIRKFPEIGIWHIKEKYQG